MYLKKHICVFVCLYLYSFASPSSISHFSALNQISTCSPSLLLQVSFILDSFLDYCLKIALWIWNKKRNMCNEMVLVFHSYVIFPTNAWSYISSKVFTFDSFFSCLIPIDLSWILLRNCLRKKKDEICLFSSDLHA